MPKETMTIKEASEAYGIPAHTIRYLVGKGKLPAKKKGTSKRSPVVFLRADLDKALEGRKERKPRGSRKAQTGTDLGVVEELKAMRQDIERLKERVDSMQQELRAATPRPGESVFAAIRRVVLG